MSRLLVALFVASMLTACGPTAYVVQGRSPFVGADGVVEVEMDEGARVVTVELENLVPPSRVDPSLTQYVLWIAPSGGQPARAATLVFNENDRSGSARATTPDARFTVIVTAEAMGTPPMPSTNVVFQQDVEAH